jgi:SlyX protein
MSAMEDLSEQLIDLQTRLAYQEDTLRQLDAVTIRQAEKIEQLELVLRELVQRLDGEQGGGASGTGHEQPPHY